MSRERGGEAGTQPGTEDRARDELLRLFPLLDRLVRSCSEHDIITDIFVRSADPDTYRDAYEGIRESIAWIGTSGIFPGAWMRAAESAKKEYGPLVGGLVDPVDLVPLLGVPFTPRQQALIGETCAGWARTLEPDDPGRLEALLEDAVHPLTLADLLAPDVTRMQRFAAIMLLQGVVEGPVPGSRPGPGQDGIVPVPATDGPGPGDVVSVPATEDPGLFCSRLNQALFSFLVRTGQVPAPSFPDLLLQALADTGMARVTGLAGILGACAGDGLPCGDLLEAGRGLAAEKQEVRDVRDLYRAAAGVLAPRMGSGRSEGHGRGLSMADMAGRAGAEDVTEVDGTGRAVPGGDDTSRHLWRVIDRAAGHILAGFALTKDGEDGTGTGPLLRFAREVASRHSGRAVPGEGERHNMEANVEGIVHLVRVMTGAYSWRPRPLPAGSGEFMLPVELVPAHHLVLYDPEELAYRGPGSSRALAMEALYREWFLPRESSPETASEAGPWYSRLVRVLTTRRAARTGRAVHPGVSRWLDQLYRDEYSEPSLVAGRPRVSGYSAAGMFLYAALFEARTGEVFPGFPFSPGSPAMQALRATREARERMARDPASDDVCLRVIREDIWPRFRELLEEKPVFIPEGRIAPAQPVRPGSPEFIPRESSPRVDTMVHSPHQPDETVMGKVIPGEGPSLIPDSSLNVPGGSAMQGGAHPGATRGMSGTGNAGPGTPGSSRAPRKGAGRTGAAGLPAPDEQEGGMSPGPRETSGLAREAAQLSDACSASRRLVEQLQERLGNQGRAGSREGPAEDIKETLAAIRERAEAIGGLARSLGDRVAGSGDTSGLEGGNAPPGLGRGPLPRAADQRLNVSIREVARAAREFQQIAGQLEQLLTSPEADPESCEYRLGMTQDALERLQEAGTAFQRLAVEGLPFPPGEETPAVPLPDVAENAGPGGISAVSRTGRLAPAFQEAFVHDAAEWESFAYFDATFGEDPAGETGVSAGGRQPRELADQRYEAREMALTHDALQYLGRLRQRSRGEWEDIEQKAERIRHIALLETHSVGQDDYALYLRFFQPVAGMTSVARKNIRQALQKMQPSRDYNELITGDDIDEENLAAVRTTMRIFRDTGREPDRSDWCLSLLIDASSSMHDETVAKKLEATVQAALLFGEAVNRVPEIRFEIAAFADSEYIPLKRFQDDWNIHQACFLIRQVVQATGGTNDVGAVSSAIERMNRLRLPSGTNRMVFVITDGQSGVGGREQMREVQAMGQGTRIFGWGVGPDMEQVEETYRPYGTWVPEVADLPRSLGEVLRRELRRPAMAGWQQHGRQDTGATSPDRGG